MLLGGHWQEGLGEKETEGKAACGWGGGERGEPEAWGEGGRNNIVAGARQVLAVSPNKKEESATLGGGGREPPPAPILQPLPVNPYSATLLKRGGASGVSPQPRSLQRYHIPVGSLGDVVPSGVGSGRSFLSLPQSLKGKKIPLSVPLFP